MESDWFNIETGVRQGDVLAPLLFIIYMDDCIREVGGLVNWERRHWCMPMTLLW